MIAVDTNVLLRYIVRDNDKQGKLADDFFKSRTVGDTAFVSLIVLAELSWVLRRQYGFTRTQINSLISNLLETDVLTVENETQLAAQYDPTGLAKVDLADWLIAFSGNLHGCDKTITFDKVAATQIDNMELLT